MRHRFGAAAICLVALLLAGCGKTPDAPSQPTAQATVQPTGKPVSIIALGDSLFAGYGLRPEQAYPVRLQAALRAKGINATIINAGVSGDTTEDGLARLDFTLSGSANPSSVGPPDLMIISLGGNDMLRGLPLAQTSANLDAILGRLAQKHIRVVVMGMLAAPNMGPDYVRRFDAIYPALSAKHHAALVPFFLQPLLGHPELQLPDHIHPTAPGVEAMVAATLDPVVKALSPELPKDRAGG